jgi:hypothetical protein
MTSITRKISIVTWEEFDAKFDATMLTAEQVRRLRECLFGFGEASHTDGFREVIVEALGSSEVAHRVRALLAIVRVVARIENLPPNDPIRPAFDDSLDLLRDLGLAKREDIAMAPGTGAVN